MPQTKKHRQFLRDRMNKIWSDPKKARELKKKQSEGLKAKWRNPEWRKKMMAARKKQGAEGKRKRAEAREFTRQLKKAEREDTPLGFDPEYTGELWELEVETTHDEAT